MIKNSIKIGLTTLLMMGVAQAGNYGTVNGEEITKGEIIQVMGPQGAQVDTLDSKMKKRVIGIIVDRKILTQNAKKSDVEKSDAFKEKMALVKDEIILNLWMKAENEKLEKSVTDADVQAYYEKNKEKYSTPAELKARHILVKTENEAKALIKELDSSKEKKATFIKLAKEKSTGPSGVQGGDLGWFSLDKMVPEFSKAADVLKKGEYTKTPVKTQFGYHLIFLDDRKVASIQKLEDVKDSIKDMLSREKFNSFMDTTLTSLKKDAKVELKEEVKVKAPTAKKCGGGKCGGDKK